MNPAPTSLAARVVLTLWLSLAALAVPVSAHAEDAAATETDSLTALLAQFAAVESLTADYREAKTMALLKEPLVSEGTLYFVAPHTLALRTRTPKPGAILVDDRRVVFVDDNNGTGELDLEDNPVVGQIVDGVRKVLAGDAAALQDVYEIELVTGDTWTMTLTPRTAPLRDMIARIELQGQGAVLSRLQVDETNGDSTVTTFDRVDPDAGLSVDDLDRKLKL